MILFIDGMAHYASAQIPKKYTVADATYTTWTIAHEGRFNNCVKRVAVDNRHAGYLEIAPLMTQAGPWTPTSSGVFGYAIKVDHLDWMYQGGTGITMPSVGIYESGFPVLFFTLNQNGTFTAYRSGNGAFGIRGILLAASVQGIRSGVWAYVEYKWNISQSTGYAQVRVNNVPVLNYGITAGGTPTGGYVWGSSVAYGFSGIWNSLQFGQMGGGPPMATSWFGDLYLADLEGSGDQIRDYVGDVTIDAIVPDGVGNTTGWTPLSGDNWNNVEEMPPDDGLTYITATAVGTRDSYTMQDVPPGTDPVCYQSLIYTRKDTEGASILSPTMRSYGTTYDAYPQGVATATDYRYIIQPYDTNPATGARITESEINAAEFGVVKVG